MRLLAEIGLVVLAGIAVAACVSLLPDARPTRRSRRAAPAPARPDQLVALERLVVSAGTSAVHAHAYLRPLLVEIASRRLAARGQTLERMPDAPARELLGDRLWDLVRPDRPFPEDRHGPGVAPQELRRDAGGARAAVSGSLAPRTPGMLALAAAGLIAALASGRPELALLSLPFLVFAGAGLILAQRAASGRRDRARPDAPARGGGRSSRPCECGTTGRTGWRSSWRRSEAGT